MNPSKINNDFQEEKKIQSNDEQSEEPDTPKVKLKNDMFGFENANSKNKILQD